MSEKPRILLVEDEKALVMTLGDRLEAEGYRCESAADGLSGFEKAVRGDWDLLILDVMLPGKNGLDICRDLRGKGLHGPILMLTARGQTLDKVLGLKMGADDYLTKPFDMAELLARVEALLRRIPAAPAAATGAATGAAAGTANPGSDPAGKRGQESYDGFSVDFSTGHVLRGSERLALSSQEFKLLAYLTDHPGIIVSRDQLLDAAWGYGSETSTRTVDVHIAWLRKKIGDADPLPRHIVTVRGLGYRFVP